MLPVDAQLTRRKKILCGVLITGIAFMIIAMALTFIYFDYRTDNVFTRAELAVANASVYKICLNVWCSKNATCYDFIRNADGNNGATLCRSIDELCFDYCVKNVNDLAWISRHMSTNDEGNYRNKKAET